MLLIALPSLLLDFVWWVHLRNIIGCLAFLSRSVSGARHDSGPPTHNPVPMTIIITSRAAHRMHVALLRSNSRADLEASRWRSLRWRWGVRRRRVIASNLEPDNYVMNSSLTRTTRGAFKYSLPARNRSSNLQWKIQPHIRWPQFICTSVFSQNLIRQNISMSRYFRHHIAHTLAGRNVLVPHCLYPLPDHGTPFDKHKDSLLHL